MSELDATSMKFMANEPGEYVGRAGGSVTYTFRATSRFSPSLGTKAILVIQTMSVFKNNPRKS